MRNAQLSARFVLVSILAVLPGLGLCSVAAAGAASPSVSSAAVRSVGPAGGDVVGIAAPITIGFATPVVDRAAAEQAIAIVPSRPVSGHFTWTNDTEVRWSPDGYWPAYTDVIVSAGGLKTDFKVGAALYAVADLSAHVFNVSINGDLVREMPASMGKPGHETPTGQFSIIDKYRTIVMDSSTYGVPVNSPEGYKLNVDWAQRIIGGIFVHSAPWSVDSQGYENVSHGCINLSPSNAQWYYNNTHYGDPVVVTW